MLYYNFISHNFQTGIFHYMHCSIIKYQSIFGSMPHDQCKTCTNHVEILLWIIQDLVLIGVPSQVSVSLKLHLNYCLGQSEVSFDL